MLSNTVYTCHDAVWILKNLSILRYVKEYEIDVDIYKDDTVEKNQIYYVLIHENDFIEKCVFKINVVKKTMEDVDYIKNLKMFRDNKFSCYNTKIQKRKIEEENN